jgi:hypothetical protein
MGKLRAFYIELENANGVFFAGQIINGRLVVELDAEMKMRGKTGTHISRVGIIMRSQWLIQS